MLLSVVLFFLYTGLEVTAGQWTYSLFTESRGVAPAVAGTWVGVYWASLTAGRIVFGSVAGRVPPLVMLRVVMLVAPLGAVLVWSNVSPVAAFIGLALMGFCFAPVFPLLISLTPGRVGQQVSDQAIGFQVSAACLGAAGVPGLTGLLTRFGGLEVVGPMLLIVSVALLVLHEVIVRVGDRAGETSVGAARARCRSAVARDPAGFRLTVVVECCCRVVTARWSNDEARLPCPREVTHGVPTTVPLDR